jgi:hypothetical protein
MKVRFLKSPTARAALGYSIGETGEIDTALAKALIEEGFAEAVAEKKQAAPAVQENKTAKRRGRKKSE